jgi:glycosyltransferase involved in cell wall biosynthesis
MMFSIIATYYQVTQSEEVVQRFIDSLKEQSFKDFEVLVVHDGPYHYEPQFDIEGLNIRFINTPIRENVWGHNARDWGIKRSKGDYVLVTNVDNVYYNVLDILAKNIKANGCPVFVTTKVLMMGMNPNVSYDEPRDYSKSLELSGEPRFCAIDMMQLVIKGDIMRSVGWWSRHVASDGLVAETLNKKFGHTKIPVIIGEHY